LVPVPELEPPVDGAGVGVVVLDPEPMPVEPEVLGLVVLPLELEPIEPLLEPEAPLPALPLRASSRHLSRSVPVRPTHLLASVPDAPEAAPAEPEVEVSLLPEDELPEADGVLEVDGVVVEPEVPLEDEPAPALPVVPEAPVLLPVEPDDCAKAMPDRARSAAAVAAVRVFNIMREIS
jgi:hypothetical protein